MGAAGLHRCKRSLLSGVGYCALLASCEGAVDPATGKLGATDVQAPADAASPVASMDAGTVTVTVITPKGPPDCATDAGVAGLWVDTFLYPAHEPRCEPLNQPGSLDETCPSEPLMRCVFNECTGSVILAGCCRPDGVCGVWDDERWVKAKSLGCISRQQWLDNDPWLGGDRDVAYCTPQD